MSVAGIVATSGVTAPDVSIGHLLLQMVVAMVLVVGGIWGFGKLMGRSRAAGRNAGRAAGGFFRSRGTGRSHEQGLTILSRQPVGKGKCIAVVQVGGQQFLVGIADSGLTPLGELHAGDPEPVPDEEPLPIAACHPGARSVDFGAAELAAVDLSALGVRPLDLGPSPAGRAAPVRQQQPPRSVRSLVDALREATVRR